MMSRNSSTQILRNNQEEKEIRYLFFEMNMACRRTELAKMFLLDYSHRLKRNDYWLIRNHKREREREDMVHLENARIEE